MSMIADCPRTFEDTKFCSVFRRGLDKNFELFEKCKSFIGVVDPLLSSIGSGPFQTYTLHNANHAVKILHIAGYIIGEDTFEALSSLELLVVVYAAYLHDIGMVLPYVDRDCVLKSDKFKSYLNSWPVLNEEIQKVQEKLSVNADDPCVSANIFQLYEAGLAGYLRESHATKERYLYFINFIKKTAGRVDLFEVDGVSFEDVLIDICVSHNQDASTLTEGFATPEERFPRDLVMAKYELNAQFCAALLRLCDILDFDRERTPVALYECLGIADRNVPGARVSLEEWQKHLSIHTIELKEDELVVHGSSRHPMIERSINDFSLIIQNEIKVVLSIIRSNPAKILSKYNFLLPSVVRTRIRSVGYLYTDMSFKLNQNAIVSLLMGENLYASRVVAVRELLQNALDACQARKLLSSKYVPSINLCICKDEDSYWLKVSDNGIGMDEHIISNYFLTLGNSYYKSLEFSSVVNKTSHENKYVPISRFGIGLASVFLLSDILVVSTRRYKSPRNDDKCRTVYVERIGELAFIRETKSDDFGTVVAIKLKTEIERDVERFKRRLLGSLHEWLVSPSVDINVVIESETLVFSKLPWFRLKPNVDEYFKKFEIIPFSYDLAEVSSVLEGRVVLLLFKKDDKTLSHMLNVRSAPGLSIINPRDIFNDYKGNMISVNGFKMFIKNMNKLISQSGSPITRMPVAFEVNILGVDNLEYNISREEIINKGKTVIVQELWKAIKKGLERDGAWDSICLSTQKLIDGKIKYVELDQSRFVVGLYVTDESLLRKVKELIPRGKWPIDLHVSIAQRLSISNSQAWRCVSTLLYRGDVEKNV